MATPSRCDAPQSAGYSHRTLSARLPLVPRRLRCRQLDASGLRNSCRRAAGASGVPNHVPARRLMQVTMRTSTTEVAAPAAPPQLTQPGKPARTRVVVLGSGWGAVSLVKNLAPAAVADGGPYELVLVSPRNYMLFTPLLPSAVGGVISETSIVESIRTVMRGKGIYYEACVVDIDPVSRQLTCIKQYCEVCAARAGRGHTDADHTFTVPYDILVCSVGAVNATFGIKGVEENCWFLKSVGDANRLRRHISKSVEHAALPGTSPEERKKLLSFVVVGGGPTGVEVAAELHDLLTEDFVHHLPQIKEDLSITLVDGLDSLLNSYHTEIQSYAGRVFARNGITCRLGTRVVGVRVGEVDVEHKEGAKCTLRFGTCIWATGIAVHPLVASLKSKLPAEVQTSRRGLLVDDYLRVLGSKGTIFALGDAAVTGPTPQTALPPTAQVARQEGEYLAQLLSKNRLSVRSASADGDAKQDDKDVARLPKRAKPFRYLHLGSLAYLGGQKGVMDLPVKLPFLKTLRGYLGGTAYKSLETLMQVSSRTRWLVMNDWVRATLFGRNISDI